MKKNIYQIIIAIGFIIYAVGKLLIAMSEKISAVYVSELSALYPILIIAFVFAKSNALKYTGYAIATIAGVDGLAIVMNANENVEMVALLPAIAMIVMMFASIAFFVSVLLNFFGFVKEGKECKSANNKVELIKLYSQLNNEDLITNEEFTTIKSSIVKGNVKESVEKLTQLKELKKLYDEQIITKEEFITFSK